MYILALVLLTWDRVRGLQTSGVLFVFWLTLSVAGVAQFLTEIGQLNLVVGSSNDMQQDFNSRCIFYRRMPPPTTTSKKDLCVALTADLKWEVHKDLQSRPLRTFPARLADLYTADKTQQQHSYNMVESGSYRILRRRAETQTI
ncbi:hypothetical protein J6590_006231 [Homalodisca vitripennis]|nr:hypothetical protein J6590_006231 [Homalodisca vitripennis]